MDRGAWQATAHGVTQSQIGLSKHKCTTFIALKSQIKSLKFYQESHSLLGIHTLTVL